MSLAPYAADAAASRGRRFPEPPSATRTAFQRDRDRILHSRAFRRLALKTQVFLPDEGDQYRTRLTHTIEVAQIARSIARSLRLDEDLTEALALAHDLGHPPFGHTGEDALDECLRAGGGFEHNAQTLRIVTALERRYPAFDGLNLTWECLEGLAKRNGPLIEAASLGPGAAPGAASPRPGVPPGIAALDAVFGFALSLYAGAEAQVASVADDIAYNAHDVEDGIEAGLFGLDDLTAVPLLGAMLGEIARSCPGLDRHRRICEVSRRTIGWFVEDVLAASRRTFEAAGTLDAAALRRLGRPAVALSAEGLAASRAIKAFLRQHMYRHPRLVRMRLQAAAIVRDLALHFIAHPQLLPPTVAPAVSQSEPDSPMQAVADHVSSLTDRGAVAWHRRLFATTPELR